MSVGILCTTLSCRSTNDSVVGRCLEELERTDPDVDWALCHADLEDEGAVRLASFCEGETGVLRGVCLGSEAIQVTKVSTSKSQIIPRAYQTPYQRPKASTLRGMGRVGVAAYQISEKQSNNNAILTYLFALLAYKAHVVGHYELFYNCF